MLRVAFSNRDTLSQNLQMYNYADVKNLSQKQKKFVRRDNLFFCVFFCGECVLKGDISFFIIIFANKS